MNIAIRTRKDLGRCFTFPNVPQGSSTSILGCFPDQQLDGAESVGRVSYRSMKINFIAVIWFGILTTLTAQRTASFFTIRVAHRKRVIMLLDGNILVREARI